MTSGKAAFSGGADLGMLRRLGADYAPRVASRRAPRAAMQAFFEGSRRLSVLYRKLETSGKPWVAAINGLCLGGAFELALSCHYRVLADHDSCPRGLAGDQGRPVSRRRRHATRGPPHADRRRLADDGQGRADPPRGRQGHGAGPCPGARGRPRRDRQGLAPRRRQARGALGPEGVQAAVRPRAFARRHDGLAGRQRHLPPRDAGQLPRREGHAGRRLRGPAGALRRRAADREPLSSPPSCARRRRPR